MPYVEVDGVKIYYEVHGEGEPVALINGIFMSTDSWAFQTIALSKRYKVLLHDCRGQWRSDKPKEGYSLDQHSEDLKRLLEHLAVHKVNLVGTSYGGAIASTFALNYPELVKSLILITVPSQPHPSLRVLANRWLSACQTRDPEKFVSAWIRDVYSEEFLSKNWSVLWDTLTEAFNGFDYEAGAILLKYAGRFLEENPLVPRLKEINVPTLIIAAEKDALNPVKSAKMMHREIASSELHIIAGAGHGVVIEKHEEINRLILDFLERVRLNPDVS